jgi:hypothetical protein
MWVDRADLSIAGNGKRYGAPTGLHVPVPAIQYRLRLALRTRQVNCRGASLPLSAEKRAKKGLITMIVGESTFVAYCTRNISSLLCSYRTLRTRIINRTET